MSLKVQKRVLYMFYRLTKASDYVKHKEFIKILKSLNFDGNEIKLIANFYCEQITAARVKNELNEWKRIKEEYDKVVYYRQIYFYFIIK